MQPQPPGVDGTLAGIPYGAKDIIETRGLPTEWGSPIYRGRIGTEDASIVRSLRECGAVLMGKTHTTAFAYRTPAPTRNPHNLEHTPGGSSSGSAAAVAAGMVPLALGTQTQGSVLRPASFCGITGFKPTYGLIPMDGVLPFAKSLDTLGFFTATAADMLALWNASTPVVGGSFGPAILSHPSDFPLGVPEPLPEVEPSMARALQDAVHRLRASGVSIQPVDLGDMLDTLNEASRVVMSVEAARVHEARYREHGAKLGHLADLIEEGFRTADARYEEAKRHIDACRIRVRELYKATPVMLVPAAVGPAPSGLASTGDPRMNAPWTALGTPAISIPMATFNGLPLGLQLTADRGEDARVLMTAVNVAAALKV